MSLFVSSTPAPAPISTTVFVVRTLIAALFVILATAQLFSFEDFPAVIAGLNIMGGDTLAPVYAAVLVTAEVFALPYLLGARLSPAMRAVSKILGWVVIGAWIAVLVWLSAMTSGVENSGILGATIAVASSWWLVGLFIITGGLMAVATTAKQAPIAEE